MCGGRGTCPFVLHHLTHHPHTSPSSHTLTHHTLTYHLVHTSPRSHITILTHHHPHTPQDQLPLHIAYTPESESIHCSALDIYDASCSKKYRASKPSTILQCSHVHDKTQLRLPVVHVLQIPLCGFGGASQVDVLNTRKSTNGHWIDMGEASGD